MLAHLCCVLFFITVHFSTIQCELTSTEVETVLKQCQTNINTSHELDKNDKLLLANWTTEFQMKQVNITSHYRLEMTRHREHNFKKVSLNTKWKECLRLHNKEIRNSKRSYFEREAQCLKVANSADRDRMKAVNQVEKEIRKWRKSYKYLSNLCEVDNPGDKETADRCLAEYIKRDNYDSTFERLILLKLDTMSDLLDKMNNCLNELEECLRSSFSDNLQNIRTVMNVLGLCYNRIRESNK
ncbi:PREDICTED: uncharacterized protein LOC106102732 [Papilio polytes]|uniref:uncharacterized protein LOC106102732 n=1 Tax=Papilio polytes TaxID=76194 RepID=UPI0006769DF8|nr:PREDICTED: uncharacterized protein LOC106102732 [Papilio polytes]